MVQNKLQQQKKLQKLNKLLIAVIEIASKKILDKFCYFLKRNLMIKRRLYLLTCISSVFLCLFILKPVHAVSLKLTPEEIQKAIEYGQKNKNMDIAAFSKQWTVSLDKGKGAATLFTLYHNVAYKARKAAVERKEFTSKDIQGALEIGDALTFSVTVYGEEYDFALHYSAKLYQKEEVIHPEFEFAPEIADASEFSKFSMPFGAFGFKFPVKNIDLNIPVTLVALLRVEKKLYLILICQIWNRFLMKQNTKYIF